MTYSYITYLLLYIGFSIPSSGQETVTLEADISGIDRPMVYLYELQSNSSSSLIDSTQADQGVFNFSRKHDYPWFYRIKIDGVSGGLQLVWDNNIKIKGNSDSLWMSKISGSEATDLWIKNQEENIDPLRTQLLNLTLAMNKAQSDQDSVRIDSITSHQKIIIEKGNQYGRSLIENNPSSFVALFTLEHQAKRLEVEQTKLYLDKLRPHWEKHPLFMSLDTWVAEKETLKIGEQAPVFVKDGLYGDQISLEAMKGSYVILDFWGTWCGPCIEMIPDLKSVYRKYQDKSLKIISIACEIGKDQEAMKRKVTSFVDKHEMDWMHVVENKSMRSSSQSLANKYAVDIFPTTYIIDPSGKIVYQGTGKGEGDNIEKILKKGLE